MAERIHILGGIDEAGLGPLLGPLVVAGLVLAGKHGESVWGALDATFCKRPRSRRDRRIRVDDSKRVNQGARGHAELERTALSLLYATGRPLPANVGELLGQGSGGDDLAAYPWYRGLEDVGLPRFGDAAKLELDAHVARCGFEKAGVRCLAYPFHVVGVGAFNRLIRKHDNKSLALFDATVPVLAACLRAAGEASATTGHAGVTLVADRHGGRAHYHALLARAFPRTPVAIVSEGRQVSRYRLGDDVEILFAENGEARAFPTAAASCLAKYVRELLVDRINAWFVERRPELAPTAGYYADGRRFLEDIGTLREQVPGDLLVRLR